MLHCLVAVGDFTQVVYVFVEVEQCLFVVVAPTFEIRLNLFFESFRVLPLPVLKDDFWLVCLRLLFAGSFVHHVHNHFGVDQAQLACAILESLLQNVKLRVIFA